MSDAIPLSRPHVSASDRAAVDRVLAGDQLSRGPRARALEDHLAKRCDRQHGVAVSSGTAGLHCVLWALDIGASAEVLLPSFTVPACVNAIRAVGATPRFVDIDESTMAMCPADAERRVSPVTRAILMVHPFGQPADVGAFTHLAEQHNLPLIEDACEAIGGTAAGAPIGSFGSASVFGFYPNKQITAGEGGAVLCNNDDLNRRLRALRNHGRQMNGRWMDQDCAGLNYRLSELNAALALSQLQRLDDIIKQRRYLAAEYDQRLSALDVKVPPRAEGMSWFCYVIRVAGHIDRDRVVERMAGDNIQCGRYFAPLHWQPAAEGKTRLPITESVAKTTIALPFFHDLSASQQDRVVASLAQALLEQN